MILSKAIHTDVPQLIGLLKALFDQEAEFEFNPEAHKRALNKILLEPTIGSILTAKKNDQVLGMVVLLFTESTALGSKVAFLEDMVILSEFRGQGIGSELIDHAIEQARKEGCKRITLLTDIDNSKAHMFYQKKGFIQSQMRPYRLLLD
jgi:GNAT superfamily N-acetyltransferase